MYENKIVYHKGYGRGTVVALDNRFIYVHFQEKDVRFSFPECFEKYLSFEDSELQRSVVQIIPKAKTEKEEEKARKDAEVAAKQKAARVARIKSSQASNEAPTDVFILNFQAPSDYEELAWFYEEFDQKTNLEELITGAKEGSTAWSVPTNAQVGDTILFLCASSSIDTYHLNGAIKEAAAYQDWVIRDFGLRERETYKKYAGRIMCVGKITSFDPKDVSSPDYNQRLIYAQIGELQLLDTPVLIKDANYISINRWNSVTRLKGYQWDRLKKLLKEQNTNLKL